jgi:Uma2 family endonuclease
VHLIYQKRDATPQFISAKIESYLQKHTANLPIGTSLAMVAAPQRATSPQPITTSSGVLLQGISWDTYQSLVRELESQPSKRLTYDNGLLEIFMPLPPHESYKRWTGRLVETLTEELDIEIRSLSACTWSRKDLAKGVEADECYYIQNEAVIRGRMDIDLTFDPPPDLAIEIDITSPSLPRLPIYSALGVPEVWRFDGEKMVILCAVDGKYQEVAASIAIPIVTPEILQTWLTQATTMGETTWVKALRRWVREMGAMTAPRSETIG